MLRIVSRILSIRDLSPLFHMEKPAEHTILLNGATAPKDFCSLFHMVDPPGLSDFQRFEAPFCALESSMALLFGLACKLYILAVTSDYV